MRALIRKPKVLFLDEHTSFLDKIKQKLVNDYIKQYYDDNKQVTIIAVTHI